MGNTIKKIKHEDKIDEIIELLFKSIIVTENHDNMLRKHDQYAPVILPVVQQLATMGCLNDESFFSLFKQLSNLPHIFESLKQLSGVSLDENCYVKAVIEQAPATNQLILAFCKFNEKIKKIKLKDEENFKKFCVDAMIQQLSYITQLPDALIKLKQHNIPQEYINSTISRAYCAELFASGIVKLNEHGMLALKYVDAFVVSLHYDYTIEGNTYIDTIVNLKKHNLLEKYADAVVKDVQYAECLVSGLIELKKLGLLDQYAQGLVEHPPYVNKMGCLIDRLKENAIFLDKYMNLLIQNGEYAEKITDCLVSLKKANILHLVDPNRLLNQLNFMAPLSKIFNYLQRHRLLTEAYFQQLTENFVPLDQISNGLFAMRQANIFKRKHIADFMEYVAFWSEARHPFSAISGRYLHRWKEVEFNQFIQDQKNKQSIKQSALRSNSVFYSQLSEKRQLLLPQWEEQTFNLYSEEKISIKDNHRFKHDTYYYRP